MKSTRMMMMTVTLAAGLSPALARAHPDAQVAYCGWNARFCSTLNDEILAGGGRLSPAMAKLPLSLTPTALQELNELRMNTGKKAVLRDGTRSAVYEKKIPAPGNTFLNFHVDVSSPAGPVVLLAKEIYLENTLTGKALARYTPFDWFLDTGLAEVRGDSLRVTDKAIVQFTIEVPRVGFDDLTLFVGDQRIGTVREIRARVVSKGETP